MITAIVYRRAVRGDVAELMRLSAACEGAPQWSEMAWCAAFRAEDEQRVVWVAERDSAMLGFAVAACSEDLAELESVVVLSRERRQGIGRDLCGRVMQWATARGARTMALEVRASSLGARALYAALGYVEQGRRRAYYRAPVEDAVLMTVSLSKPTV
jgi:ribosomal protein S18 acetylase RimI-like enzyme